MNIKNKNYMMLIIWIISFMSISSLIGALMKNNVNTWYEELNRSSLTPPNYLFGIVWSILYALIAISGWLIWRVKNYHEFKLIRKFYILQIILNWSWVPLFFKYHLIGMALFCLIVIIVLVVILIIKVYKDLMIVLLLLTPYLIWLLFASYLNFYIWYFN